MTLKELVEKYGEDTEIELSLYSCGSTYTEEVTDKTPIKVVEKDGRKRLSLMQKATK